MNEPRPLQRSDTSSTGSGLLVVENNEMYSGQWTPILSGNHFTVRTTIGAEETLTAAVKHPPELILLVNRQQGNDSFEICRALKTDRRTAEIPVVFLGADGDQLSRLRAFDAGAADYITNPTETDELLSRLQMHIRFQNLRSSLSSAADQLRLARKMEAVGLFAGGIAQEFNNILSGIGGYAEIIKTHQLDREHPAVASIDQIIAGTSRAASLVRQIQDLWERYRIELERNALQRQVSPPQLSAISRDSRQLNHH